MSENNVKISFVQKLENFWYHYKWHTIIGVFAMVLGIVCLVQCTSNKGPDVLILYAGNYNVVNETAETGLDDLVKEDTNNDGDKRADVHQIIIPIADVGDGYQLEDPVAHTNNEELKNFYIQVTNGDAIVYILHPHLYERCVGYNVLVPLKDIDADIPEEAVFGEYGVKISELFAYGRTTLNHYPEESIMCIRKKTPRDDEEFYQNNMDFFVTLLEE